MGVFHQQRLSVPELDATFLVYYANKLEKAHGRVNTLSNGISKKTLRKQAKNIGKNSTLLLQRQSNKLILNCPSPTHT